jgi:hypothetical protein
MVTNVRECHKKIWGGAMNLFWPFSQQCSFVLQNGFNGDRSTATTSFQNRVIDPTVNRARRDFKVQSSFDERHCRVRLGRLADRPDYCFSSRILVDRLYGDWL